MITINLLPEEIRQARRKRLLSVKLNIVSVLIAVVVAAAFILVHAAFFGYNFYLKSRSAKLNARYEALKPEADQIALLKEKIETLVRKKTVVLDLIKKRVLWSKKLNELSELIPGQVWLTRYEIVRKTEQISQKTKMPDGTTVEKMIPVTYYALEYEGGVLSMERREMLYLIGDFIASIKNKQGYFDAFSDIELISTERDKDKETSREYMKFKLSSRFKEGFI